MKAKKGSTPKSRGRGQGYPVKIKPLSSFRVRTVSRGDRNIAWIEKHCFIPEGKDVGKPTVLREWQRNEIRKIYDNPAGTRMAIISFAKKNAKTTMAAFLLLLHLAGPESKENTQLPSTAQSREQAAVLFRLAAKIVRMSPTLSVAIDIKDSAKELHCTERGTVYKALSAEASTAHGLSPVFVVHDELGQIKGPISELFNAIENAMGAHETPMSVVISTQAPTDNDLLSILMDDALAGKDPRVTVSLYTADPELDPFSEEALKQANPAFGDFLNSTELMDQAMKAKRMPSQEPLYRNYTLNQRVEASTPFISKSIWQACIGSVPESFEGLPVYAGLDLSDTNDLTALVLMANIQGVWHVKPIFWLPDEGLADKARHDRVPYDLWKRQGFLTTTEGKSVEYEFVAEFLFDIFGLLDIRAVGFDRWNFKHLKPWLEKAGFTPKQMEKFVEFGQGFQSMSPALRSLETLILNNKVIHDNNPILNMCAANCVVQRDPAGNRKLSKMRSRGRIDGMVALTIATGVSETFVPTPVIDVNDFLRNAVVA